MITHNNAIAPKGFGPTPDSNTGVKETKVLEAGIDWIAGTVDGSNLAEVMAYLRGRFSDEFAEGKNIGFYKRSYRSVKGIVIGLQPHHTVGENRTEAYVSIPARVLAELQQQGIKEVLSKLNSYSFHYSRLDLKLDDYTKTITPQRAYEAVRSGSISGFKSYRWISSGKVAGTAGDTLELGRRGKSGCGKFVRIYDKSVESAGEIDATRLELELSSDRCRATAEVLSFLPIDQWAQAILEIISGSMDFVTYDPSGRYDRATRLDWWEKIVGGVNRCKLSVSRSVVSTVEQMKAWFKHQVAPGLATLLNALKEDWDTFFWECLFDGETRMKERHNAAVALYHAMKHQLFQTPNETLNYAK